MTITPITTLTDYFLFCHCIIYTSPKSAVLLADQEISCADLRFLYYIPAERRSAGTLVLLIIIASTTLAFGFFTLHSYLFT